MSKQFLKEDLNDCMLYPETMFKQNNRTTVLLTWTLSNYRQLKKNVLYCRNEMDADANWTLRLQRSNDTAFVSLVSNQIHKAVYFSVFSSTVSEILYNPICREIADGHYVTEFNDRMLTDRKSKLLYNGALILQCRYVSKPAESTTRCLIYGNLRMHDDADELSVDIRKLYETGCYSDFTVRVDETNFTVHKAILCARSPFFRDMFIKNSFDGKEFSLETSPYVMHQVLLFMYSGELNEYLDYESVMEAFYIARTLQISSLLHRCLKRLEENITSSNVHDITVFSKDAESKELTCAIINFLAKQEGVLPEDMLNKIKKVPISEKQITEENSDQSCFEHQQHTENTQTVISF